MVGSRLTKISTHLVSSSGPHPAPSRAVLAAESRLVIVEVDSFVVECPLTAQQQQIMDEGIANMAGGPGRRAPFIGFYNTTGVTRIRTSDPDVTGYGWVQCPAEEVRSILVGENPMDVERLLAKGLGKSDPDASNTAKRPYMGA
eukprot:COSAG02_NODE_2459_length_8804_cov_3.707295_11_plen_144_part_00